MRLPTAVLLVAAFGALGCGRVREIRGCRALAALVNPVLDDIAGKVAKDQSATHYRYAAKRYDKLATDLKRFELGIPRAEKTVDDLGAAMKEASVQSAKLADAIEKKEVVIAASARRELGQVARLEKAIATRLAGDCPGN